MGRKRRADPVRQREAVQTARHLHIGEHDAYVVRALQDEQRLVGVGGFQDVEARLAQHVDVEQAKQRLVVDHEDPRVGRRPVKIHGGDL